MRCYTDAIEQIIDHPVPDGLETFNELAEWLNGFGYELHIYSVGRIPLKEIRNIQGYAIVTQILPDKSLHATLTYCGIIDKNNSGRGRQFARPEYPVTLITQLERI